MSALRAIGRIFLLTLTTAFIVGFVFAVFYALNPIPENRSLSSGDLALMGMQIGMPLGALLGAIVTTGVVLSEKRPPLDYVLAGAAGGLFAANSAILLVALGEPASNPIVSLAGLILGGLIGTFRNKLWQDKAAG